MGDLLLLFSSVGIGCTLVERMWRAHAARAKRVGLAVGQIPVIPRRRPMAVRREVAHG
ncbi:hypothetical protein [Lysobacter arvi]|uniref:Uncharacterized protein n=1 Tax=Lysobacter arvi TaxID=3038776 RepID=A0ABU1CB53_9GAMM|nr:hypothetical protein [Lysobacter arvi]MDR0182428.1 hypothetical protein [Lysobacter arvi]